MSNSTVWINGHELGGRPYGYIGFSFDLTPYLNFGGASNVIAVRLTPEDRSSRWYPGAGIYRNVWIDVTGPLHVGALGDICHHSSGLGRGKLGCGEDRSPQPPERGAQGHACYIGDGRVEQHRGARYQRCNHSRRPLRLLSPARSPCRIRSVGTLEHPYQYTLVSEVMDGKTSVDRYRRRSASAPSPSTRTKASC